MYRILIVDDEERIRAFVRKYAVFEGHEVTEAANGMEAVEICKQQDFDIIVIDIMMPELDGFSACREIRRMKDTPIIMLTARGEEYDRINGFESGVDDYVVKPFSPKELMLRIDAIMRRVKNGGEAAKPQEIKTFTFNGLTVDFGARMVFVDGGRIEMSPKEYDLFFYMVRNRGIALSRNRLIEDVWGYEYEGDERTLDTHIKLIRKNLGDYARCIVTLRGVGYRFEADDRQ